MTLLGTLKQSGIDPSGGGGGGSGGDGAAGNRNGLMPRARIGGPMPWVIAIMVALTVLAAGAGLALSNLAGNARSQISGGLTVQIVEAAPVQREQQTAAALAFFAGRSDVENVRLVPDTEVAALLDPWLGDGIEQEDGLPVPALIDVQMRAEVTAPLLRSWREELAQSAPAARLDAQANWLGPVFDAIASLQYLAIGLVVLLAVTSVAAVWLAARSALGSNSETIEIVHHLGGSDSQIAAIFQRSIAVDAGIGGLAGLLLGLAAIFALGQQFSALGSGLVAGGGLGLVDWIIMACIPVLGVALAVLTARFTVLSTLRKML